MVTLLGRNGYGQDDSTVTAQSWGCCGRIPVAFDFAGHDPYRRPDTRMHRSDWVSVSCQKDRQVFPTLTVQENLICIAANRLGAVRPWSLERGGVDLFPRMPWRAARPVGRATLSRGEQQMLARGAGALMTQSAVVDT